MAYPRGGLAKALLSLGGLGAAYAAGAVGVLTGAPTRNAAAAEGRRNRGNAGGVGGAGAAGAGAGGGASQQPAAEVMNPDAIVSPSDRNKRYLWTPDRISAVTAAYLQGCATAGLRSMDNPYRLAEIYKGGLVDNAAAKGRTFVQELQFVAEYKLSEAHVIHWKLSLDVSGINIRLAANVRTRFEIVAKGVPPRRVFLDEFAHAV